MAAPLTGLGSRPTIHGLPTCACGCGRDASRGFPGDVHFAAACVAPAMRFPWERGYAAPSQTAGPASAPSIAAPPADLFAEPQPA